MATFRGRTFPPRVFLGPGGGKQDPSSLRRFPGGSGGRRGREAGQKGDPHRAPQLQRSEGPLGKVGGGSWKQPVGLPQGPQVWQKRLPGVREAVVSRPGHLALGSGRRGEERGSAWILLPPEEPMPRLGAAQWAEAEELRHISVSRKSCTCWIPTLQVACERCKPQTRKGEVGTLAHLNNKGIDTRVL